MKDRKNLKLLASVIAVLIISAFILHCISILVQDKFSDTIYLDRQNAEEFYSLEKNTVDVLAIGSSQVLAGFSAPDLYMNYGIASFGLGTCNQPLLGAYYWLLEALKTQKPKIVLLEMAALYGKNEKEEAAFFRSISIMKNTSKYKLQAVNDILKFFESADKLSYFSSLYKFHSRWEEIDKNDYLFLMNLEQPTYDGAAVINRIVKDKLNSADYYVEKTNEATEPEEDRVFYLEKITKLCSDNEIELILFKTPKQTWGSKYYTYVSQFAEKFGMSFIDFNIKELVETIDLDFKMDFTDKSHLNATGAQKLTNSLGKYLSENYNLEDRRGDEKYASYDNTAQKYIDALNNVIISRIKD